MQRPNTGHGYTDARHPVHLPITRSASPQDAEAIAAIYNQGIEDRIATFETEPRSADDIGTWFEAGRPCVVVEDDGKVLAFASLSPYRPRGCYHGIGEFSVYVDRSVRGKGFGRLAMEGLIAEARERGYWKLLSRIFPENTASLSLCWALGFRNVGTYRMHGKLDGVWRDTVIVELLIPENLD